jgi:isochorismate synthase EntC
LLESAQSNNALAQGWQSVRVQSFTSYAELSSAYASNAIDPSVEAILYDNEHWQFTPQEEQAQPAYYEQQASKVVHLHHLLFIATPATDLVLALEPNATHGSLYDTYLWLKIAADAARYAEVFEIQSQGSEANTLQFQNFVQQAASQARSANPHVIVLAGLSTNPTGHQVTADQLYEVIMATQKDVSGYWLNVPGQSLFCPSCVAPQPQVGIELLEELW